MREIIDIFKQIQDTSSKNEKIEIIRANKDNEMFKKCLVFLLDGNITTGISKKKLSKNVHAEKVYGIHDFEDLMDYLEDNNTGRDEDIGVCKDALEFVDEEDLWFYEGMITKSLKLGCDKSSVNKAIPGLIYEHKVMLGSGQDKLKLKKDEYFYLSQKMNGNRVSFVNGKLISRQGKEFIGLQHIIKDVNCLGLSQHFIDGELIRKNTDGLSDGENFRIGTGIINSDAETKEEIMLVIFDMFPLEEYLKDGCSKHTYGMRKQYMKRTSTDIDLGGFENVDVVPFVYEGTDTSKIDEYLEKAVELGWEGLMLAKDEIYQSKRSTSLIKIKRFYTNDLEVIAVEEGDGRLKGTLGALVVAYKGNTVNVGSGYSDEQRKELWDMREEIIGRVIEVKFKEETMDKKTGLMSLQFPIFCGLREPGKQVSYD